MATLRLLGPAGPIGNADILDNWFLFDPDIVAAESDRYAVAGSSLIHRFQGERQVTELIGSFRYAAGPEDESSPSGGAVTAIKVYIGNRLIAVLDFDGPVGFHNLRRHTQRLISSDDFEVIGNDRANMLVV